MCDEIELPTYVKTSGSSGLHVLVPLGHKCDYEQSRQLGHLLAQVVVSELPEIATITRTIRDREGRVYVDFLQNRRGQLLVAPFSVRPVPEAAVSTPLKWSEVTQRLEIRKHTIRTVPARMKRLKGGDPFFGVLKDRPQPHRRARAVGAACGLKTRGYRPERETRRVGFTSESSEPEPIRKAGK